MWQGEDRVCRGFYVESQDPVVGEEPVHASAHEDGVSAYKNSKWQHDFRLFPEPGLGIKYLA